MRRLLLVCCSVLLACSACAGGAGPSHPAAAPRLPRALATAWAERADRIATIADAGNGCAAKRLAGSLRDTVIAQEAEVPLRLRTSLLRTVTTLADRVVCVPPPPQTHPKPKPPKDHGHGPPPGHGPHGHGPPGHGGDQGDQGGGG